MVGLIKARVCAAMSRMCSRLRYTKRGCVDGTVATTLPGCHVPTLILPHVCLAQWRIGVLIERHQLPKVESNFAWIMTRSHDEATFGHYISQSTRQPQCETERQS
ncbi:hypothetical protein E2C01_018757 [Portunus trituberculatus]|uniref:Uncharacterized protein n=1 Tax=Portunus trituberculatus TaxID=210409 RepID=A0A5B7DX89_PORTR|nr:hypothetical protein [Portunus trituberculatus]